MNRDLTNVLRTLGACADAIEWAKSYESDWAKALEECPRRNWLLWLAGRLCNRGYFPRTAIVLCACAYARTALKHIPEGEERPLKAIEAAEKWTRGEATVEEVREARDAADAAVYAVIVFVYAAYAADAAAYAATASVYAAYAADAAAYAYAANAYAGAAHANNEDTLLSLTKQHLGAALIEGLTKYATVLENP